MDLFTLLKVSINHYFTKLLYLRVEEMDGQKEVNIGGKVVMIAEGALI